MAIVPVILYYGAGKTYCEMCDKKKQRVAWFRRPVLHDGRDVYSACPKCMKRWVIKRDSRDFLWVIPKLLKWKNKAVHKCWAPPNGKGYLSLKRSYEEIFN
jgi:hypothetical protein